MTGEHADLVSVVVPVCNEEGNLPEFRARLAAVLARREFECVLVDDGSTDATPSSGWIRPSRHGTGGGPARARALTSWPEKEIFGHRHRHGR